ncbi:DUF935 domain-containing protein [Caulobacter soli]|uniref:DUF935 domain-containing protein n=1 Tax=Caulobacter soli TaxID=2708539 RepID=UPI0013EC16FB|nr:DUF935 domain-containing protein [Caulobacter soli]
MARTSLVDHLGRPIDFGALKKPQGGPTLTGIRSVIGGHPADGLTPQRLTRILRQADQGDGEAYYELAEQMEEKYLHYNAVLGVRKRAVSQLEISVDAALDDAASVRHADFVRDWVDRDELESELFHILDAVGKATSFTAIGWDTSEGQWMPSSLEWRDPRWFTTDLVDGRTPMLRAEDGTLERLAPFAWIHHEHQAKSGLPIRSGLARPAAWAYLFQAFAIKDWVALAEVFGLPLRVGRYDNGETAENIRLLAHAVAGIASDASAVFPKSMDVEFIKGDTSGGTDLFERLCEYLDKQVSKAVLGQTATTDSVVGGLGSGKEHGDVREDIQRADAKLLAATLNRDLIRPMIDLNFGPQKKYPRLRIGKSEAWDPAVMMPALKTFVELGGKVGASVIRDKLSIPDPGADEELLVAPQQPVSPLALPNPANDPQGGQKPPGGSPTVARDPSAPPAALLKPLKEALAAAALSLAPGRDAIEVFTADELSGWEAVIDPIIAPIEATLAACSTLEEARDKLASAIAGIDAAALAQLLARAGFAARLVGQSGLPLAEGG